MTRPNRSRVVSTVLALLAALLIPLVTATPALAAPPFPQCPPIGFDTSCGVLIVVNPGTPPTATVMYDPAQPPLDGLDDTLVGVLNTSGVTVAALRLTCPTCPAPMFGFDGDGLCTQPGAPPSCATAITGYEGPGTRFSNYCAPSCGTGTVNVDANPAGGCGLAPGAWTFFSLQGVLKAAFPVAATVLVPHAEAIGVVGTAPAGFGLVHAGPVTGAPAGASTAAASVPGADLVRATATAPTYLASAARAYTGIVSVAGVSATATDTRADIACVGATRTFTGSSTTADLTVSGTTLVNATPGPNFAVPVPECGPGGEVVLNEQVPLLGGDGMQVTGLRVVCLGVDVSFSVTRVWLA